MNLANLCVNPLPKAVMDWCDKNSDCVSNKYCAYLEYIDNEMVERIFGTRRYKKHGVRITEVIRRSTGDSGSCVKNLLFKGMYYVTVYERKDICGRYGEKIFLAEDYNKWYDASCHIGVSYVYINPEYIKAVDEFKYCGYSTGDVTTYLNAYRKDNTIEFFGKLGIELRPSLINKVKKDKAFRKWLFNNRGGIANHGAQAILFAYKNNITIEEASQACYLKRQLDALVARRVPEIKGTKLDRVRVLDYIDQNGINYTSYDDYLKSIKFLKLDLSDTKNIYPRDFNQMHELRAAEYAAKRAAADETARAELYAAFAYKAQRAKEFEVTGEKYILKSPTTIHDLVREGEMLSHCVGRMGYDKKMADGISLIMFVRKKEDPDTPYITVEWRFDKNMLNQCYGYKDSAPASDVMEFVNAWASDMASRKGSDT